MDSNGYLGLAITPYFVTMIDKYTVSGSSCTKNVARMKHNLIECKFVVSRQISLFYEMYCLIMRLNQELSLLLLLTLTKILESSCNFMSDEQSDQREVGAKE